jgi:hypothetical protein
LVYDGGRGRRAAKQSRATVLTRRWQHIDSNMMTTAQLSTSGEVMEAPWH